MKNINDQYENFVYELNQVAHGKLVKTGKYDVSFKYVLECIKLVFGIELHPTQIDCNGWQIDIWGQFKNGDKTYALTGSMWYGQYYVEQLQKKENE